MKQVARQMWRDEGDDAIRIHSIIMDSSPHLRVKPPVLPSVPTPKLPYAPPSVFSGRGYQQRASSLPPSPSPLISPLAVPDSKEFAFSLETIAHNVIALDSTSDISAVEVYIEHLLSQQVSIHQLSVNKARIKHGNDRIDEVLMVELSNLIDHNLFPTTRLTKATDIFRLNLHIEVKTDPINGAVKFKARGCADTKMSMLGFCLASLSALWWGDFVDVMS